MTSQKSSQTVIHLVTHTHWDREWYQPFQQFRLRLVHLIDNVLALLEDDTEFQHFMLDGQAIVLEDYLTVRPDRREQISQQVRSGRLLIGPWYILPDEFLVSPEATVRNLLQGERSTRPFGTKMKVGYIPDPFGHLAQMPQILRGFGIQAAVLRRGLDDQPVELWWQAPDGSRVFLSYLREGYGNAVQLPARLPKHYANEIKRQVDLLAPHQRTHHFLLMHGTDHSEPPRETSQAIAAAHDLLGAEVRHSTLPAYLQAMQAEIEQSGLEIPTVYGELRSSKRHDLLPGVLSTRMDVKQLNHHCENLLERWAEPTSAWLHWLEGEPRGYQSSPRLQKPADLLRLAWKTLLENHPHDSICGCSIDPVYEDMDRRFAAVEDIGESLTRQNLSALSAQIDTRIDSANQAHSALVVFNASPFPQTGLVQVDLDLPLIQAPFELINAQGQVIPAEVNFQPGENLVGFDWTPAEARAQAPVLMGGCLKNACVIAADVRCSNGQVEIDWALSPFHQPDPDAVQYTLEQLDRCLADPAVTRCTLRGHTSAHAKLRFLAIDVPALGYRTYWMRPVSEPQPASMKTDQTSISNEYFRVTVQANGTLEVQDLSSGRVYRDMHRLEDSGDCGDLYNYCAPQQDERISFNLIEAQAEQGPLGQSLLLRLAADLPTGLTPDRAARSSQRVTAHVLTRVSLLPGVRRVDFTSEVINLSRDHRLRVHFPVPFGANQALFDGHFQIIQRDLLLPEFDATWQEHPRPELPQRLFCDVSHPGEGLMLVNQGLPEVEVIPGEASSEIALTLLRCTGWLARGDLPNRKSQAGPPYATPVAQMQGIYRFAYALIPHDGDWQTAAPAAYGFDLAMRAALTELHPGRLPAHGELVSLNTPGFILTTVKIAEDEQGVILRGYQANEPQIPLSLRPSLPFQQAARSRLDETRIETLHPTGGEVITPVRPNEIVTLRFN